MADKAKVLGVSVEPAGKSQKIEDTSKIERKAGEAGKPRTRSGIEPRGTCPDRRQLDNSAKFPLWDDEAEEKYGKRRPNNDRRKAERRIGPTEQRTQPAERRGTATRPHRSTDYEYVRKTGNRQISSDAVEGASSATVVGMRKSEERMSLGPTPSRPPNTAAAVAVGAKASPFGGKTSPPAVTSSAKLPIKKLPGDDFKSFGERLKLGWTALKKKLGDEESTKQKEE